MRTSFTSRLGLLLVMLSLVTSTVPAQTTITGRLTGNVTDQQGAVISKPQVVAVHDETKAEFKTTGNSEGGWSIPSVPNGTYTVTVTHAGLQSYRRAECKSRYWNDGDCQRGA